MSEQKLVKATIPMCPECGTELNPGGVCCIAGHVVPVGQKTDLGVWVPADRKVVQEMKAIFDRPAHAATGAVEISASQLQDWIARLEDPDDQ